MSNFMIIGRILIGSQCLLSISLRLYLDWIQWKSIILVAMASLTLWEDVVPIAQGGMRKGSAGNSRPVITEHIGH